MLPSHWNQPIVLIRNQEVCLRDILSISRYTVTLDHEEHSSPNNITNCYLFFVYEDAVKGNCGNYQKTVDTPYRHRSLALGTHRSR